MVPPARITARAEEIVVWKEWVGSRRRYLSVVVDCVVESEGV
jgi:hypothetical protein